MAELVEASFLNCSAGPCAGSLFTKFKLSKTPVKSSLPAVRRFFLPGRHFCTRISIPYVCMYQIKPKTFLKMEGSLKQTAGKVVVLALGVLVGLAAYDILKTKVLIPFKVV